MAKGAPATQPHDSPKHYIKVAVGEQYRFRFRNWPGEFPRGKINPVVTTTMPRSLGRCREKRAPVSLRQKR
jgi:hypothetical protein